MSATAVNIKGLRAEETAEAPKAVLTVKSEPSQIFRGETVTLTCGVQEGNVTYTWQCGENKQLKSNEKEMKITPDHTQKCMCQGCGRGCSYWSDEVTLNVSERPKAVLTVKPEPSQIFRGETVTLTCDVQGEGWTYRWQCDGKDQRSNEKEFKITVDHTQMCWCDGCRGSGSGSGSVCSDSSDEVTLTVTEKPKPVVTVEPEPSQILRGETVTLTCDVQGEGWTYRWLCDGKDHNSNEKEFKITADHTQMCWCYSCRGSGSGSGSVCSDSSNEVTLTVTDKPRVSVKPQNSVFTGDTVTLSCDARRSTGRRINWYKGSKRIKTGDEKSYTLRDVRVSDGGEYWCGVENLTQGHRVTLTVRERPKAVLRVHPDGRVFRGQTVTLTCDIQETDVTRWTYTWNKDNSEIHDSQSQKYRISSVSESHTGHYSCRGRETGGSRHTHTSDEVTLTLSEGSRALMIGIITGLSISFLLIFLLVLLWRCKHKKGGGSLSPSTDHQQHNIRQTEEQKRSEQTPQQSEIEMTYSEIDLKSVKEIKENQDNDVTYSEIDLKSVKEMKKNKKKENKGKTGESSDTVYSKLKIGTG
ncbi:B-cell receptor CD22-like [Pseudorasbora parva]|uniref:B-cell receptor CD22-like n=1 Tax=Pseudorasbora parva TaxID=51549 RepID=UPI00351EDF78